MEEEDKARIEMGKEIRKENPGDGTIVIDTPEGILRFNLLQLKYAMKLELKGIKVTRRSVYAYVKKRFGLKGNRQSVYRQFCTMHNLEV